MKPDYCQIDYDCKSVSGPTPTFGDFTENQLDCDSIISNLTCEEEDLSDCDITIPVDPSNYPGGGIPPGTYCITISGCNPASAVEQCEDSEICVTLEDFCDPPEQV